ncbi:hypothetical protein ACJ6G6_17840 [Acinetobacter baumannii]|uniref:hypothetical protein n=3 Tax=Acinetobacter baumannii TaxID=470 RepID=UPI00396C70DE
MPLFALGRKATTKFSCSAGRCTRKPNRNKVALGRYLVSSFAWAQNFRTVSIFVGWTPKKIETCRSLGRTALGAIAFVRIRISVIRIVLNMLRMFREDIVKLSLPITKMLSAFWGNVPLPKLVAAQPTFNDWISYAYHQIMLRMFREGIVKLSLPITKMLSAFWGNVPLPKLVAAQPTFNDWISYAYHQIMLRMFREGIVKLRLPITKMLSAFWGNVPLPKLVAAQPTYLCLSLGDL